MNDDNFVRTVTKRLSEAADKIRVAAPPPGLRRRVRRRQVRTGILTILLSCFGISSVALVARSSLLDGPPLGGNDAASSVGTSDSGLAYALDYRTDGRISSVYVLDPAADPPAVLSTFSVGIYPSIAVDSSGQSLFVLSYADESGQLELNMAELTSDTGTLIRQTPISQEPGALVPYETTGPPVSPSMAITPDGSKIYITEYSPHDTVKSGLSIATYDTSTGKMLTDTAHTDCHEYAVLMPLAQPEEVGIWCGNKVQFLQISSSGSIQDLQSVDLPNQPEAGTDFNGSALANWVAAAISPGRQTIYVATASGRLAVVDVDTRTLQDTIQLPLSQPETIATDLLSVTDQNRLVVGVGNTTDDSSFRADAFAQFDAGGSMIGDVSPLDPFERMFVASDELMAFSPDSQEVQRVRLSDGSITSFEGIGEPSLMFTAGR